MEAESVSTEKLLPISYWPVRLLQVLSLRQFWKHAITADQYDHLSLENMSHFSLCNFRWFFLFEFDLINLSYTMEGGWGLLIHFRAAVG